MASKRPATDQPEETLPPKIDLSWNRLGLVFYCDNNAGPIHHATKHLVGQRMQDWYREYGMGLENDDEETGEDTSSGEKSGSDAERESDLIHEIKGHLGVYGDEIKLEVGSYAGRHDNAYDIILGRFHTPFVSVRIPASMTVSKTDKTVVLVWGMAKRWDVPVSVELLVGSVDDYNALIKDDWITAEARTKAKDEKYVAALRNLRCDKAAVLYAGTNTCSTYFQHQSKDRSPSFMVDTTEGFDALLGNDLLPQERALWTTMWQKWIGSD